jgi:hypothetical protein
MKRAVMILGTACLVSGAGAAVAAAPASAASPAAASAPAGLLCLPAPGVGLLCSVPTPV